MNIYQITSTNKSEKIKEILRKVEKYKLYEEFDNVYILIIGQKLRDRSKELIEADYKFKFL